MRKLSDSFDIGECMKKKRSVGLIIFIIFLFLTSYGFCQESVLKILRDNSKIVAHIKVLDIMGGKVEESGVVECDALCEVISVYKGNIKPKDKIRFRFNNFEYKFDPSKKPIKESFKIEKNNEYIIFLNGTSGRIKFATDDTLYPSYVLTDRWLGVQYYDIYLEDRILNYLN